MSPLKNTMAKAATLRKQNPPEPASKSSTPPMLANRMAIAPVVSAVKDLALATEKAAAANQQLLIKIVAAVERPAPDGVIAPTRWVFTVERDENGLMTRVIAER